MDWETCIICGKGDGALKCPADRTTGDAKNTYEVFLQNTQGFRHLDKMPVELALSQNVTAEELLDKHAKWHKSCHLKFANSKLQRAKERYSESKNEHSERKSRRLSGETPVIDSQEKTCILCLQSNGTLHSCSTMSLDKSLRDIATELQDTELLSRIATGDLVALEAKYHNRCLTNYKNRHRSMQRDKKTQTLEKSNDIVDSRVFAELTSYIESEVEEGNQIFKLSELHQLFAERLSTLGFPKCVNKTKLKERLLDHFAPECQEQSDGKSTILVFNDGMQRIMKEAIYTRNFEEEALSMARMSKGIRREISNGKFFKFTGCFPVDCEEKAVPESLRSLVSMLLYGPNIKCQTVENTRACLSICQLILFNFKENSPSKCSTSTRHDMNREPPLPLYIGLNIHSVTRSKKLVTDLCERGLSVSYGRVLELEDMLTAAVCQRYATDGLVCPPQLRRGLLTVGALDNIDHNPTSTTAKGSFHGTSISVFQFPSLSNPGVCNEGISLPENGSQLQSALPDSFTVVPAVACNTSRITVKPNTLQSSVIETGRNLKEEIDTETKWFERSIPLLSKEKLQKDDFVAWGAYHASSQPDMSVHPGISTLLPLFPEKAATIAMVKHGMTAVKQIVDKCNPGQIPVIAVDQPLFALAKYVQWNWPESHGENEYIVMFGGLHIEMTLWRVVGDLLDGSGWTNALTEADVASPGTADSFLSVSHLTKTRRAHQVTALALAKLQRDACLVMVGQTGGGEFEAWKEDMSRKSPMFKFWDLILRLQILILIFVRAHRQQDFSLYVAVLEALVSYCFILDHTNYARWLPVHIRDLKALPDHVKEDMKHCWTFPKTNRIFSAIPLDQAHEQNNKLIKDSGGAVGLTENPSALKRWMVSGPEQVRLLKEFQRNDKIEETVASHDQGLATQESFKKQVNSLCQTVASMGNPFLEESEELMRLDTHDCVDQDVKKSLDDLESNAKIQYEEYVKSVLDEKTRTIQSPIKKNNLPLFKRPTKEKSKAKQNADDLKSDYCLFSQLYIASQVREGDLEEFFAHENHPWPPSLSQHGKLRLPGSKSELLDCMGMDTDHEPPLCDTKIVDGATIVHSLPRGDTTNFGEYSQKVFLPWTEKQLKNCRRLDVVWDTYKADSLKEATRDKRGKGTRRKVKHETRMPVNFMSFLRDSTNKEELFALLSADVASYIYPAGKEVYITQGKAVIVRGGDTEMQDTDHEEADTRICLHVQDAIQHGAKNIVVSTVDTDVVVILLGIFTLLTTVASAFQLWVEFGKGKILRYYNINSAYHQVGEEVAKALPFFHAFTGSDTTSQFAGRGKRTSWKAWKSFPQASLAFSAPTRNSFSPMNEETEEFKTLERFTCVLYDSTTQIEKVNDLRRDLFAKGKHVKMMQNLPPTQAALVQHVNRSLYQASIWLTSLMSTQNAPSPDSFGWVHACDNSWQPLWTTLPEAAKSSRELIKCGCKALPLCSRKCICKTNMLKCTSLCTCKGNC